MPYNSEQRAGRILVFPLSCERLVIFGGWDPVDTSVYVLESKVFHKHLWRAVGAALF